MAAKTRTASDTLLTPAPIRPRGSCPGGTGSGLASGSATGVGTIGRFIGHARASLVDDADGGAAPADTAPSSRLPGMPIVGDVLAGRYRIDAPIGVGGMASVYRATDQRLEREVAVKVLLPNLAADSTLAQRFEREALALAATSHPSVVKVFDVEPGDPATGREPFYVMELCDGGSLADRIAARGRLDPGEVADVIGAVAAGLADLHGRGFVHRDVKPHNILFDHGRARLADFGLARSDQDAERTALTATGTTAGTLAYLAPELLRGDPATPASDVYALGVVAFQGLTGRLPRPAAALTELVESHAQPAPTVSSVAPELGTAFDAPVAAAMALDPSARPAPVELAEGLAAALPGAGLPAGDALPPVALAEAAAAIDARDPDADTVTDIPQEWPADAAGAADRGQPGSRAHRSRCSRSAPWCLRSSPSSP